jgi:Glycogen recognition site of AMP-activated protein kinase
LFSIWGTEARGSHVERIEPVREVRALRAQQWMSGVALLITALSGRSQAQEVQAALSVTGGSATDVLGVTSRAVTLVPSLTVVPDPRAAFTINGSATRFDNQQWAAGAGASAAMHAPLGRLAALTLNGGADATTTSYEFSYYTASAMPAIEANAGAVTAYVGAHVGLASASTTQQQTQTPAGLLGGNASTSRSSITASRTVRGALFGANVRIPGSDGETVIAGVREEHATIDTVPTVDRSASLAVMNGRFTIAGTAGVRNEPGTSTTFASGVLSFAVNSAMSVDLNAGSYPADRLIGTRAGRYVNVGVSLRTGRSSPPSQPSREGAPAMTAGFTRLAIRDDDASRVDVAGDFTNWKPITTHRAPNGVWYIDLRIPAGQYRYAFRVNGSEWRVPDGATAVDDDLGGKSAWLVVSAPSGTTHQEEE